MEITGTQTIAAPRADVWQALNDPATLRRCLPGCESVERLTPEEFRIVITAAIGPLRPRFNGTLRMTEAAPPASCVMVFEGQGGAMGFGKGTATVSLREDGGATELSYAARAQVGGKLAQVGSRLIDGVARKISDDFFAAFHRQFGGGEGGAGIAPAGGGAARSGDEAVSRGTAEGEVAPSSPPSSAPSGASPGPSPSPAAGSAASAASYPTASRPEPSPRVPGWWLAVAFALGVAATVVGALLVR